MNLSNELYVGRNHGWYPSHLKGFSGSAAQSHLHLVNLPESMVRNSNSYGHFSLSNPLSHVHPSSATFHASNIDPCLKKSSFFNSSGSSMSPVNSTGSTVSHLYGSISPPSPVLAENSLISSTENNTRVSAFGKFNANGHEYGSRFRDVSSSFSSYGCASMEPNSNLAISSMPSSFATPANVCSMGSFYDHFSNYNSSPPSGGYSLLNRTIPSTKAPSNFSSLNSGNSSGSSTSGSPPQLYNAHGNSKLNIDIYQSSSCVDDEYDDPPYICKTEEDDETLSLQDMPFDWMRRGHNSAICQPGIFRFFN